MKIVIKWFVDPAERAASTFIQQFLTLLIASGSAGLLGVQNWSQAATVAGFAALISLVMSYGTSYIPPVSHLLDFWLRVFKTLCQSFGAVLIADHATSFVNADWKSAISTALVTTIGVFVKGGAMAALNPLTGASALPIGFDTGTVDAITDMPLVSDHGDGDPGDQEMPLVGDDVSLPRHSEANLSNQA